jgi:hypothetical protein
MNKTVRWDQVSCRLWVRLSRRRIHFLAVAYALAFVVLGGTERSNRAESITASQLENGLNQVESDHFKLVTDLPVDDRIRELPLVFEQALPQWSKEFSVADSQWNEAKVTAYLMLNRDRFVELKLIPPESNAFRNGYQLEDRLFLIEQPSAYYRRHLLLHEATHWFLWKFFGGNGPPWFSEGQCERMGTHRWDGKVLTLEAIPARTEEVPYWGRIKMIRDDLKQGNAPSLTSIFHYSNTAHRADSPYAWSWAAVTFFSNHPRYRVAFRELVKPPLDYSNAITQNWIEAIQNERNLVEAE